MPIDKHYTENAVYQYSKIYLDNEIRILLEIKGDRQGHTDKLEALLQAL